jgi:hypothetical protein
VGVPGPADSRIGRTLPATHTDLFAPAGPSAAPGFGALPPELAAYPDRAPDGGRAGDYAHGGRDGDAGPAGSPDPGPDEDLDDDADDHFEDEADDDTPGSGEPWVSYSATRAGWRKRLLRVRVRSDGAVPELVLVARPGTQPPTTLGDGQVLARLAPCSERATRTMEVRLEGALLPWGIRLLPASAGVDGLQVDHPSHDTLVVR